MIRFLLPVVLFLLFIGESIYVDIIPSEIFGIDRVFVPRFLVVAIILISVFLGKAQGVIYGAIFGFLFDVIYTGVLGIYTFIFPIVAYITFYISKMLQVNIIILTVCSVIGIAILEFFVYGLYYLIGTNSLTIDIFIMERLLPTLILNSFFMVILYYPFRKLLTRIAEQKSNE